MAKVESFELDHTAVKAPYVRLGGRYDHDGVVLSKYDLRFIQPNQDAMATSGMHSIEHLLATYLRDHLAGVVDLSPMGCRTGFYLSVWGEPEIKEIRDALVVTLEELLEVQEVPATTKESCGYYKDHSLFSAQEYIKQVLDQGFSLDPFTRIV